MSKIYRLHSGASDSVQDWTQIDNYLDSSAIDQIPDSAGASARQQITSIPSPFARIDLVKTAFKNVVAGGHPKGLSIFHKMVSDSLDVGQIFFNSINPGSKVEILPWNPGLNWVGDTMIVEDHSDLGELLQSGSEGHRLYGATLKMFFSQDAAAYNFQHLQQLFLLNYKDGPAKLNIIGGTSPATLFFCSANKLDYVDITYGNDKLFDATYCPLYERNEDFILYLYSLKASIDAFQERFKVVADYMDMCLPYLHKDLRQKVNALDRGNYEQYYERISLAGEGNYPEITGYELRALKLDHTEPREKSDFVIAATQAILGLPPLVLPAYAFNGRLNYVHNKWPAQLKAPYVDPLPLTERTLPGQEIRYPYLTVSDFLEPYLIQLPFEPNGDKYFNGYLPAGHKEGYLLPLTPAFFTYFSSADLRKPLPDGRRMFEFERLGSNQVKAKLRVPIKDGRFIDMERVYDMESTQQGAAPNPARNQGLIRSHKFSLVIYPFVKRQKDAGSAYTIMLLDQDTVHRAVAGYQLKYYKDAGQEQVLPQARRQKSHKQAHTIDTVYDVVGSEFDYIIIEADKARGCLVPLFPVKRSINRQYTFSVDFGTTNTHIEYSVDGSLPQALDITRDDEQVGMLHRDNRETLETLNTARFGLGATLLLEQVPKELMPEYLGGNTKYKFPRRTVLSEPLGIDVSRDTYPLADFSIYWQYDTGPRAKHLKAHTNLKWADHKDMGKRIEGYIANLVLLMRNKVVLNEGDLSRMKIIWFYPSSMTDGRLHRIEKIWYEQVEKYIGPDIAIVHLPESVAPFYFFRNQSGVKGGNEPVINIDIGGGTTDVVVYKGEQITSFTSFKFAGNALFGDVYNTPPAANGFVQFFERECRDLLAGTLLEQLLPGKEKIERSEEFITTLFGLQHHPDRGELSFSFTEKLNETEELKLIPLIFIASIFYHIARYQQHKGQAAPRYITFSGTASKMLQILDVSKGMRSITRLVNRIFKDVLGTEQVNIELVVAAGPKEVTAKGGLYNPVPSNEEKSVLFGCEDVREVTTLTYGAALEDTVRSAVLQEVSAFIDLFFAWNNALDFANEFSLSTKRFEIFRQELKSDLDRFLVEGIEELKAEMERDDESKMNETLFFMPLKGALNKLAFYITDNN